MSEVTGKSQDSASAKALVGIRSIRKQRDADPIRAAAITAIERAVAYLGRHATRRAIGRRARRDLGFDIGTPAVEVVDMVADEQADRGFVTVGSLAARLGLDPSQASRMVAEAVGVGYVERVASQRDGRRIELRLTEAGKEILALVQDYKRAVVAERGQDWPRAQLVELAALLTRFVKEPGEERGR